MSALRRVLSAPGLVIGLILVQLLLGWQLAGAVRATAAASMRGYSWIDDGHLLHALSELMATHPAVGAALVQSAMTGGLLAIVFWALAYGGVITRLAGKRPARELAAASIAHLPGICAQTVYLGAVRVIPMIGIGAMASKLPALAVLLGLGLTVLTVVGADIARVHIVLHGGRVWHPKTAVLALRHALKRPKLLAAAGSLAILQLIVPAILGYVVFADLAGAGSIWIARALSALGLLLGLWRIAVVVEAFPPRDDAHSPGA
jgi:hypothetical protein